MTTVYILVAVFSVSLVSLVGLFSFSLSSEKLEKRLIYLVSISAGTLLGDAFLHLIPEAYEKNGESDKIALIVLGGILTFFILEKFVYWRHCHEVASEAHPHPFSYMILAGDTLHNFIDGMVIAASFFVGPTIGVATTVAVFLHEIPQEIGDFGSLLYAGFSRAKALLFNFGTALSALAGATLVILTSSNGGGFSEFLVPFAAGGFVYIASSDLIPELHKSTDPKKSLGQLLMFLLGIGMMFGLTMFE